MPTEGFCKIRRLQYGIEKRISLYLLVAVSKSGDVFLHSSLYLRSSCHRNKYIRQKLGGCPGTRKTSGYPGTRSSIWQYPAGRVGSGLHNLAGTRSWRVYPTRKGPTSTQEQLETLENDEPRHPTCWSVAPFGRTALAGTGLYIYER